MPPSLSKTSLPHATSLVLLSLVLYPTLSCAQGGRTAQELVQITNNRLGYTDRLEVVLQGGRFAGIRMLWGWHNVIDDASIKELETGKTFYTPRMKAKAYTVRLASVNGRWALKADSFADLSMTNDYGMNERLHIYRDGASWRAARTFGGLGGEKHQEVNRLRIFADFFGNINHVEWGLEGR